ncbi:MAG: hypothetical protein ABI867_35555 [Kofleriaceae bacterium]
MIRGATIAAVSLVATLPAGAEPCVARAELGGDEAAVVVVSAELARLGVERGRPAPGCRGIVAQVESSGDGGIAVAIRDGSRRSEGRIVGDAAVAASWIESWLRDDLDGTAWLLASPPVVARSVSAPVIVAHAEPHARSIIDRVAIAFAYEQSWLEDEATATGVSAAACVDVGRVCLGARARYASEGDHEVNMTAMARRDASIVATASYPISLGRLRLVPELGLGVGRTSTRRIETCTSSAMTPPNCDPMDPTCDLMQPTCTDPSTGNAGKTFVGDGLDTATYTPRLAAAVRIVIPLFDHVWLDGLASITFGPFGHSTDFTVAPGADGTVPGGAAADDVAIPGESRRAVVLGIGIRVGSP